VVGQVQLDAAPRLMHEPGHPHADANGFVAYPRIDTLSEMLGIMQATRPYESNVSTNKAARSMAMKAAGIGGERGNEERAKDSDRQTWTGRHIKARGRGPVKLHRQLVPFLRLF